MSARTWTSQVLARTTDCLTDVFLEKFSQSQHRPSLITPPRLKIPAYSNPVKCWNFHKADWKCFCLLTGDSVERLSPLDTTNIEKAYHEFCKSLLFAAKQCIYPMRPSQELCAIWDKECKTVYHSFLRAPLGTNSDRAASSLLPQLKREDAGAMEKSC